MFDSLDIGCGDVPQGTVNCDRYIIDVDNHRGNVAKINPKKIPNFVVCDAAYLPFKRDAFDSVFSAQVIEHVDDPLLMVREMLRVSRGKVTVETVHRYGERFIHWRPAQARWCRLHHVNKFNWFWFYRVSQVLRCVKRDSYLKVFFYFPHRYFCLFRFPYEIGVVLEKSGETLC